MRGRVSRSVSSTSAILEVRYLDISSIEVSCLEVSCPERQCLEVVRSRSWRRAPRCECLELLSRAVVSSCCPERLRGCWPWAIASRPPSWSHRPGARTSMLLPPSLALELPCSVWFTATRVERVSLSPLTPAVTICVDLSVKRQAKNAALRASRVDMIDRYCGVTCMRYPAVATWSAPKFWLIVESREARVVATRQLHLRRVDASAKRPRGHADGVLESPVFSEESGLRNAGAVIRTWSRGRRIDSGPRLRQRGVNERERRASA